MRYGCSKETSTKETSLKSYTNLLPTDPHIAIICGQTSCGKTLFVLDLLESKYKDVFGNIVTLCRTIKYNNSYKDSDLIHTDPEIYLVDCGERLNDYIRAFYSVFATKALSNKRNMLSEPAFSVRRVLESSWILTQKYTSVLIDFKEQTKWLASFHSNDRDLFEECLRENDVIPREEKNNVRKLLAETGHSLVILKTEQPAEYAIVTNT